MPCLATGTPAPATTKADAVEMLKRALGVAAGAARIDGAVRRTHGEHLARAWRGRRRRSHRRSRRARASHEKAGDLRRGGAAGHDQLEGFGGFVLGKSGAGGDLADGAAKVGGPRAALSAAGSEGTDRFPWAGARARRSTRARSRKLASS